MTFYLSVPSGEPYLTALNTTAMQDEMWAWPPRGFRSPQYRYVAFYSPKSLMIFKDFVLCCRSISSTSTHELPPKCPTLPIPDYSPGPSDTPGKPRQQYRRRTGGRGGDHRNKKDNHPAMGGNTANGHIQGERPLKKSRDVKDNIEVYT